MALGTYNFVLLTHDSAGHLGEKLIPFPVPALTLQHSSAGMIHRKDDLQNIAPSLQMDILHNNTDTQYTVLLLHTQSHLAWLLNQNPSPEWKERNYFNDMLYNVQIPWKDKGKGSTSISV